MECTRYIVSAIKKQYNEDERTLEELFYSTIDEMAGISFLELFSLESLSNMRLTMFMAQRA